MNIDGVHHRTILLNDDGWSVRVIDQRKLPWSVEWARLDNLAAAVKAIRDMWVRGAPLIGATAAYGLALGLREDASDAGLLSAYGRLLETRPTAVNLRWALDETAAAARPLSGDARVEAAYRRAAEICEEDVTLCRAIGEHGAAILKAIAQKKDGPVQVLTHCNAGWLATVDYGTALAPLYVAHDAGAPIHVWVDETRPRNQGASLTAFELAQHGIPHTVIVDNAGGLLMQRGQVDVCIVGADRVAANGDVCNKVGTYLKALAAKDTGVPFYVAFPYTTIDMGAADGDQVVIEDRGPDEVREIQGRGPDGVLTTVQITGSPAANPAFDVTPARLISGYITERGVSARLPVADQRG